MLGRRRCAVCPWWTGSACREGRRAAEIGWPRWPGGSVRHTADPPPLPSPSSSASVSATPRPFLLLAAVLASLSSPNSSTLRPLMHTQIGSCDALVHPPDTLADSPVAVLINQPMVALVSLRILNTLQLRLVRLPYSGKQARSISASLPP